MNKQWSIFLAFLFISCGTPFDHEQVSVKDERKPGPCDLGEEHVCEDPIGGDVDLIMDGADLVIKVGAAPEAYDAWGIDIAYDTSSYTYTGSSPGTCEWTMEGCSTPEQSATMGIIRCGAFNVNPQEAGSSCELRRIHLTPIAARFDIEVAALIDDFEQWSHSGACYMQPKP